MNRLYVDPALFRAPMKSSHLDLRGDWPDARAYFDTSQVGSPYKHGFFQDNSLLGSEPSGIPTWAVVLGCFGIGFFWAKAVVR